MELAQECANVQAIGHRCDAESPWASSKAARACQSALVSGDVDYECDPLQPPPPGQVLLCCTQPRGDLALDL
jgi:hypothetical protein